MTNTNTQYRSMTDAQQFVFGLGLKSIEEWNEYAHSPQRPTNIPADPAEVYGSTFPGMRTFMGISENHAYSWTLEDADKMTSASNERYYISEANLHANVLHEDESAGGQDSPEKTTRTKQYAGSP